MGELRASETSALVPEMLLQGIVMDSGCYQEKARAKLSPTEPETSRAAGGIEVEVAQSSAPRAKERKKS